MSPCCFQAAERYLEALSVLNKRENCPQIWNLITFELSGVYCTIASLLQDYTPLSMTSRDEVCIVLSIHFEYLKLLTSGSSKNADRIYCLPKLNRGDFVLSDDLFCRICRSMPCHRFCLPTWFNKTTVSLARLRKQCCQDEHSNAAHFLNLKMSVWAYWVGPNIIWELFEYSICFLAVKMILHVDIYVRMSNLGLGAAMNI